MATIKDIARIAGVSQGTVSNVLNGRSNVSAEKIKLVREVAQQLGYSINLQAKQLRGDPKDTSAIALILPNISESKYSQLFEAVKSYFERHQRNVFLFVTDDLPHVEQNIVATIAAMRVAGVISVTCCSNVRLSYRPLFQSGAQVIFALRSPDDHADLITFDYYRAGQEIAQKALSLRVETIGLLDCPNCSSASISLENSLRNTLHQVCSAEKRPEPVLRIMKSTLPSVGKSIAKIFAEGTAPELIICASREYADQITFAIEATASKQRPHLIALSHYSLCAPKSRTFSPYWLDYGKLGTTAAVHLDKRIDMGRKGISEENSAPCSTVLPPMGFKEESFSPHLTHRPHLNVLLMKGQSADALTAIAGRFSEKTNIEIDFTILPPEEIYETCVGMKEDNTFDVVRASVSVLPIIPLQMFRPFSQEDYRAITSGMAPMLIEPLSMVKNIPYAIPFDVGSQVLVYRKDIFMDPMVKRMYFEKYGQNLEVPSDFQAFNQVVSFFNQNKNPASPVRYSTSVSLGTNSEAFLSFILRYRALVGNPGSEHFLNDFNPFLSCQVLDQCKELCQDACVLQKSSWFGAAHDNFIRGNSAMEIIAFNYASDITRLHTLAANSQIGYSLVPGGHPVLGGGSMLITKQCKEYQAALDFVAWACGQNNAELFTYLGGVSPHLHVYKNQEILNLYPWYRLFLETIERSSYRELWDQFHVYKLERLIGNAVRSVVSGEMAPQEASSFISNHISSCRLHNENIWIDSP